MDNVVAFPDCISLCQDGMFRATAAADVTIQDHCVVHHTDHLLHLKYNFDLTVFGHVPQLCSQAAAVFHLSCASASAASKLLHTHTQLQNACL